MDTLYEFLLFPERAENLGQHASYDVDLAHWKALSGEFRTIFRTVHDRGSTSVLLVHGAQGTGKTLFSRRLEQDWEKTRNGAYEPDVENLWHTLVGEDVPTRATIQAATTGAVLRRIEPAVKWLEELRTFAEKDRSRVRIFVIDDAHKDVFMREWAGLSHEAYLGFKERGSNIALSSVAENLVADCRGDFQRSIFVLLSNNAEQMTTLKEHVERSHRGLARVMELPLPAAAIKEKIVRKNTNRLNRVSYWYCLEAANPVQRGAVYDVLRATDRGFTDAFEAVNEALTSGTKRSGRPANRNLITLVTLGAEPAAVEEFLENHELSPHEHTAGIHLGGWLMREQWASTLYTGNDPDRARRARMMESEFAFRWVALDMKTTALLCETSKNFEEILKRQGVRAVLFELIRLTPSIAKPGEMAALCHRLDAEIDALDVDVESFARSFSAKGQQRSVSYEEVLRDLFKPYGRGFAVYPTVKPDYIVEEYRPCAITEAKDHAGIAEAIRRGCHAIEFTAHLQSDMRGLKDYVLGKVERYAELLESV